MEDSGEPKEEAGCGVVGLIMRWSYASVGEQATSSTRCFAFDFAPDLEDLSQGLSYIHNVAVLQAAATYEAQQDSRQETIECPPLLCSCHNNVLLATCHMGTCSAIYCIVLENGGHEFSCCF